ncbi:IPT/TIG domain-containing protein [Terrabacter sp. Root85]|uniref:IPT/TIG domain-containing protein n=1 Tax=Terrabacter sp. Root85 TaxID=1736603 RepID=UPI003510601B
MSPTTGPTTGGTVVTITGSNLTGATAVKFGTIAGTNLTVVSSTQVKATSPAGSAGAVTVSVTTPGGTTTASNATQFSYTTPTSCGTSYTDIQHISGSIASNMTWAPDCAGTYVLDGQVTVNAGASLTVTAGTVVKSYQGSLTVNGTLTATGTSTSPVVFTSLRDEPTPTAPPPPPPPATGTGSTSTPTARPPSTTPLSPTPAPASTAPTWTSWSCATALSDRAPATASRPTWTAPASTPAPQRSR